MDSITVAQLATEHQQRTAQLADLAETLLSAHHRDPEVVLQLQIAALEQGAELLWALQVVLAAQEKIEAARQAREDAAARRVLVRLRRWFTRAPKGSASVNRAA